MEMQSKVHPTHKTDRLMAMACLELQRHGRVRWFFYHHPHTVLALVLVFAVGVFAPGVASAQDATIAGTVTDATGGILPGVAVEVRDAAGTAQVTVTDGTGQFTFSGLAPGTYDVMFTLSGFTVPAQVVEASAGATAVLDVEMAVGGLAAQVVVVGTRAQPRSVTASPVPIDAIPLQDVVRQGATTLDYQLRTLVPSFNVATHPISDAATLVRPASLRNLAHDHTLVLVNGKRRHRSSVIAWFAGVTDGAQGPDISTIPSIALRQVEVLRDGASAQYGSDAIAGVINFLLKDDRSGGSLEFNTGTYRAGDGDAYTMAGHVGLPLGDTGFVNLSLEYGNADPTNRSVQRADAAALIAAGNTDVADPAQIWGNPTIEDELKLFGNFGHLFANQMQFYGHANYAEKKVTEGFYFRNPNNRANIYSLDDGATLLIRRRARRARRHRGRLGSLSHGARHEQRAGPGGSRAGVRRPTLLLLSRDDSGRVHAAVRRRGQRQVGGGRRAAARGERPDLGCQRQLRRPRVGLLFQQHRQRVARPGHAPQLRPGAVPPGGSKSQR